MNKRLITIIITGLIIEALCLAIVSIGDIKANIPGFAFLYIASFVVYIFAVFYVLKNTKTSEEAGIETAQYQVGNHLSSPPSRPAKPFGRAQGGDKGEVTKFNEAPLNNLQLQKNNSKKIFWVILAFSLIFRLTLLPVIPSDDLYRYLWEGKLQLNGINPYSYPPESSNLEYLRDNFFSGINHKQLTTIYPPLTLMTFAVADYISHSVLSMKSIFLVFDVLSIFILVRFLRVMGREPINVLIYAWSPLVLISFAARGHCDSLQIFLLILALYLYSVRKNLKSIISISLAAISKFIFIIMTPFLIPGRKLKYIAVLFSVIGILYLPYIGAGKGLFSTLFHFGSQYHYNDSIHFLIFSLSLGSPFVSKIITIVIFGLVLLLLYKKHIDSFFINDNLNPPLRQGGWFPPFRKSPQFPPFSKGGYGGFRRINDSVLNSAFWSIGAFLILAPTVHPWYLTWIIPLPC